MKKEYNNKDLLLWKMKFDQSNNNNNNNKNGNSCEEGIFNEEERSTREDIIDIVVLSGIVHFLS